MPKIDFYLDVAEMQVEANHLSLLKLHLGHQSNIIKIKNGCPMS